MPTSAVMLGPLGEPEHVLLFLCGVALGLILGFLIETILVPHYAAWIAAHEDLPERRRFGGRHLPERRHDGRR